VEYVWITKRVEQVQVDKHQHYRGGLAAAQLVNILLDLAASRCALQIHGSNHECYSQHGGWSHLGCSACSALDWPCATS
jgi:hypothetical protein